MMTNLAKLAIYCNSYIVVKAIYITHKQIKLNIAHRIVPVHYSIFLKFKNNFLRHVKYALATTCSN